VNNVGAAYLLNSIIAQGTSMMSTEVYGKVISLGHNLIANADSSSGWIDSDQNGTTGSPIAPNLGTFRYNGGSTQTMELLAGSPAVNSGSDTVLIDPYNFATDQRGTARKIGVHVDIGAYESNSLEAGLPVNTYGTSVSSDNLAIRLFPNPASRELRADYKLTASAAVTLELYTMEGARVAVALDGAERESGDHSEEINISALSPGTYTLQLMIPVGRGIQQFVVVR
jgi:hypothetical protein